MIVRLPLPPTDNRRLIFAFNLRRFISSPEYKTWLIKASHEWDRQVKQYHLDDPKWDAQYSYEYSIYLPNRRSDVTNYTKALKDFLKDRLYTDDKWVDLKLEMPVLLDKEDPRIEINLKGTVHNVVKTKIVID